MDDLRFLKRLANDKMAEALTLQAAVRRKQAGEKCATMADHVLGFGNEVSPAGVFSRQCRVCGQECLASLKFGSAMWERRYMVTREAWEQDHTVFDRMAR